VYRNTVEIAGYARRFIGYPDERELQDQAQLFHDFFDFHGPRPEIRRYTNLATMASDVAELIKELHENNGYPFSEIAILYTVKSAGTDNSTSIPHLFSRTLEAKGILSTWVSEDSRSKHAYDITTNRVTISTIHSAKGLDYACVFLVGFDFLEPGKPWSEEEIRSLAYVGITRARYRLFISYMQETTIVNQLIVL